ncbi:hypothetical protein AQUCO_00200257v1 [Aquilegia coerulea]|uniref:Uncharacterized protein n=1 Tax=Aquilegia coerulea TaxID=218851 RepID=A0A2G5F2D6_AQUCA|nr:hypothetical protein AQUCO_00200257v1 [Aquilegia coerulea]
MDGMERGSIGVKLMPLGAIPLLYETYGNDMQLCLNRHFLLFSLFSFLLPYNPKPISIRVRVFRKKSFFFKMESRGNSPKEGSESLIDDNMTEMVFHKRGCCFWIPCLGSDRSNKLGGSPSPWWERIGNAENEEKWWNKGWKAVLKVREWSEIMAGPKWKTFIRRFNKKNGGGGGGGGSSGGGSLLSGGGGKQRKFQYDPLSYSLNFDEGPGHNGQSDEDYVFRDFSSRYATIPISAKTSMDLGKDGPTFT